MFVDKTRIYIKSGKGGDGCVSFRREKYIPRGGPDGGSGGRGGDVYLEVSRQISTLLDFSYQPHYKAKDGSPGSGNDRYGKDAEDLFIKVPQGTVVYRAGKDKSYEFVCDLKNIDDRILFGGGRHLDFKGEETTTLAQTVLIQSNLEIILRDIILPNIPFEIEHRWSGIMGVGNQKKAIVKQLSNHVYCGVRLGGMGIAIGSSIGNNLAQLVD